MKIKSESLGNSWITQIKALSSITLPEKRLLCFPYAGGGSSAFMSWRALIPPNIELLAVELPGRERRFHEKPWTDFIGAVQNITDALAQLPLLPTVYFGHSLGALLAFAVARTFESREHPASPCALVLSACEPPHIDKDGENGPAWKLDDTNFIHKLRELNGTPEQFLESPDLLDLFLPILRADFQLADEARSRIGGQIRIPTTVLGGFKDDIQYEELLQWQKYAFFPINIHMFAGDHFFLKTELAPLCSIMTKIMNVARK